MQFIAKAPANEEKRIFGQLTDRISEALNILLTDLRPKRGHCDVRMLSKRKKERTISVSKQLIDRIRAKFQGTTWLFEHSGHQYNRASMSSRIKLESLKILGRDISAIPCGTPAPRTLSKRLAA